MQRIEIKKWLLDQGLTQTAIAREARVSSALVSLTLQGKRKSPQVIQVLLARGCPEELILQEEAA
ncbi:MAG: hypothetical protein LLF99_06815 [Desulfobacteraceae bacterium]|nr:hypothetical protein [Desulfobacteraceae bacterium]